MSAYLSSNEVARALGIHPTTFQVWRYRGKINIPYEKIGRAVVYRLEDIERYILDNLN